MNGYLFGGASLAVLIALGAMWTAKLEADRQRDLVTDRATAVCAQAGLSFVEYAKPKKGQTAGKELARRHWGRQCAERVGKLAAFKSAADAKVISDGITRQAITDQAETKALEGQARIVTRTHTLVKEVTRVVPPDADPVVPADLVRLFDQAAAGGDGGDAVSFSTGLTHEAAAPVRLSQIGRAYVVNLGIGHQNNRTLSDLQAWVRAQEGVR